MYIPSSVDRSGCARVQKLLLFCGSLNLTLERSSPGERRPAEARRVADPLGMQARGSAARLRAARLASGEEAAGLRLGGGKVLDHPVQHGLELAQAVHGLLHDREEEETIRQLSIDAAGNSAPLPTNVRWQWHEHEVVTSLPTVAMSEIISWRKSWNPWKYRKHMVKSSSCGAAAAGEPEKWSDSRRRAMGIGWVVGAAHLHVLLVVVERVVHPGVVERPPLLVRQHCTRATRAKRNSC